MFPILAFYCEKMKENGEKLKKVKKKEKKTSSHEFVVKDKNDEVI